MLGTVKKYFPDAVIAYSDTDGSSFDRSLGTKPIKMWNDEFLDHFIR